MTNPHVLKSLVRAARIAFISGIALFGFAASLRAQNVPLALWRFEPGAFFADSSGNNRTLQNGTGASVAVPDPAVGPSGGAGSALFDGSAVLRTTLPLDLTAFSHIRVSWWQRLQSTNTALVVYEHTTNFANNLGAFMVNVNRVPPTGGVGVLGSVNFSGIDTNNTLKVATDFYPHSLGVVGGGSWERFRVDISRVATSQFGVVRVFNNANIQIGTDATLAGGPQAFANSTFFIGARGNNAELGFVGNIDEILIENVPDVDAPTTPPPTTTDPVNTVNPILDIVGNAGGSADGVIVDAKGVLRMHRFGADNPALQRKRLAEARANLNADVARPSELRKVSLNRLEAAVKAQLAAQQPLTEEMKFLAGMTRVRYLFYYPDTKDIVLAGPAEGWIQDAAQTPRGLESGRPLLQLQDLIVALRAFQPAQQPVPVILVSIDPTAEGLARMQSFLRSVGSHATPEDTEGIVNGLRNNLGMQNIRVSGVAANTHFAKVLLECDYRMKLIGIGLEKPPVKIVSYVDRATPGRSSRNALQRWYFVPDYNCVRLAADGLGMELVGDGVKLVGEDQIVSKEGGRSVTGRGNKASDLFTTTFTKKYAELAARVPVFAEMRNCIDLAIVSAFIQQQDLYAQAGWQAATFDNERAIAVETANVPQHTETVCTAVWKGNTLMTPVGGGVTIHPREALRTKNTLADEDGKVTELRESVNLKDLPADKWWWD